MSFEAEDCSTHGQDSTASPFTRSSTPSHWPSPRDFGKTCKPVEVDETFIGRREGARKGWRSGAQERCFDAR